MDFLQFHGWRLGKEGLLGTLHCFADEAGGIGVEEMQEHTAVSIEAVRAIFIHAAARKNTHLSPGRMEPC
ncbi:hypothetical protein CO641_13620 [Lysobacteraceae bacterium NML91-0213]|nr:hypothetical protein CO641_13620 [Xanthomonadaceae bacterium NML91-0213]